MYDIKSIEKLEENKDSLRSDCIGDRSYFKQIQYECMFELKSIHVPTEGLLR